MSLQFVVDISVIIRHWFHKSLSIIVLYNSTFLTSYKTVESVEFYALNKEIKR